MSNDSDVGELLLLYALSRSQKKRVWVHDINKKRNDLGEYHRLCRELASHEDRFFTYFRMSQVLFEELHDLLIPKISKCTTNWRTPISTRERLVICLRYLATGDSHQTIAFSFRVGRSTVGGIVKEVCKEIWNTLQPEYMPSPTEETWIQSEKGTEEPVPHVFIGDEGFALKTYLMRPFPRASATQDERKTKFNKRLCRARRVVENAFGILAQKWRIFLRPIDCDVDTGIDVIKAAGC
ncbi:uncharacterized protein LOC110386017 isoform X2 [Bombyx mori]|uniref:uncharacterized protein LOC110386017 isoform X2 n=1 Tax=Bombyx mori TaxID=7091 RepID=UPI002ED1E3FF